MDPTLDDRAWCLRSWSGVCNSHVDPMQCDKNSTNNFQCCSDVDVERGGRWINRSLSLNLFCKLNHFSVVCNLVWTIILAFPGKFRWGSIIGTCCEKLFWRAYASWRSPPVQFFMEITSLSLIVCIPATLILFQIHWRIPVG